MGKVESSCFFNHPVCTCYYLLFFLYGGKTKCELFHVKRFCGYNILVHHIIVYLCTMMLEPIPMNVACVMHNSDFVPLLCVFLQINCVLKVHGLSNKKLINILKLQLIDVFLSFLFHRKCSECEMTQQKVCLDVPKQTTVPNYDVHSPNVIG